MLRKTQHAFTLVEILCVVTILAIASALIVPQLSTRDDLKAAAGARTVMSDFIWAQNRAISTQQKQYIIFSGQSYTLWYADSSAVLHTDTQPVTLGTYTTTMGAKNTAMSDVSIVGTPSFAGKGSLCFDEMGTPWGYDGTNTFSMSTAGTIQISAGHLPKPLTISIEGLTGEASVQ